jgi:glycosyltransferase involved in cell wall biosynthesis
LFAERKGIPVLIEAFDRVAARYPNAILRIIGSGPAEAEIQATVARSTHQAAIQLVGKKLHSEVLQEMLWADCFALVGWDEPFATVYSKRWPLASRLFAVTMAGSRMSLKMEYRLHGSAPIDRCTAEAIDRMLSNPAQRMQMGQNAQQLIEQHLTWDVKAKELIQLMEAAVSSSKPMSRSIAER